MTLTILRITSHYDSTYSRCKEIGNVIILQATDA